MCRSTASISLCRHHQRTLLLFTCHSTKAGTQSPPFAPLAFRWRTVVWQQICCSCGFGKLSLTCGIRRPPEPWTLNPWLPPQRGQQKSCALAVFTTFPRPAAAGAYLLVKFIKYFCGCCLCFVTLFFVSSLAVLCSFLFIRAPHFLCTAKLLTFLILKKLLAHIFTAPTV